MPSGLLGGVSVTLRIRALKLQIPPFAGWWPAFRPNLLRLLAGTVADRIKSEPWTIRCVSRPQTGFNIQFSVSCIERLREPATRQCSGRLPMAVGFGAWLLY